MRDINAYLDPDQAADADIVRTWTPINEIGD
jgi:hypothetical protein